jgi:hypothetical protein
LILKDVLLFLKSAAKVQKKSKYRKAKVKRIKSSGAACSAFNSCFVKGCAFKCLRRSRLRVPASSFLLAVTGSNTCGVQCFVFNGLRSSILRVQLPAAFNAARSIE